ncbi:MAG: dephospho-CoA kinase [Bacteroidota bacterium]
MVSDKQMLVGITGGIGSGKTTICKVFETLGAKTYYADDRAKWLMEHDQELVNQVKALFGEEAYLHGNLNRKLIADRAYHDDSLLTKLNSVVHPAVGRDTQEWIKKHDDAKLLLKEAALLFETGIYRQLYKNILVLAPKEIRIQRVLQRDSHRDEPAVKAIISKQMDDEEKIPLADYLIQNDGNQSVIRQVMKIYDDLLVA